MQLEFRVGGASSWERTAALARWVEGAGVSGLEFPEAGQAPRMSMSAAGWRRAGCGWGRVWWWRLPVALW
jgi:hypothetical protein